ncbi:hypothetical protein M434DRAFT_9063 [Hypoxylon sp. CO27-5]|nr:hypothetical protein M434DRAFT_9063 [Hypoxylon sp. CO27-5]
MEPNSDRDPPRRATGADADGSGSAEQPVAWEQQARETNMRAANSDARTSAHFLTTTGTLLPRPILVPSTRNLTPRAAGKRVAFNNNTSAENNSSIEMPQSSSSTARKGRSAGNPFLPWGVRGNNVRFPRSAQLDDTHLPFVPPDHPEAQQQEPQDQQQEQHQHQQSTVEKLKVTLRNVRDSIVGIFPGWPEVNTVQNILYGLISIALGSVIASIAVLKHTDNPTEDELTTIWLWIIVSVVVLVFLLAFNNHRDAQLEESGGARHYARNWVELGDLHNRAQAQAAAAASAQHNHPRGSFPPITPIEHRRTQFDESRASRQASTSRGPRDHTE